MSATVSRWPRRARPTAVTRPTWPAPIRNRCIEAPAGGRGRGHSSVGYPFGRPRGVPPIVKVAFVAANTFRYDARQMRAARAVAGDGHEVVLVRLAGSGPPASEDLENGIELRRVAVDGTIASAFRPLPTVARRAFARLLGFDPAATQLPPTRPTGIDRLRAPFRRL